MAVKSYTLIRQDRENDWRQTVFTLIVEHLRGLGFRVRIENRATFGVRNPCFLMPVTIRDSLAILQNDCTGLYWILDCHDWTVPWDLHFFRWDLRCRGILKCQHRTGDVKGFRSRIVRPWTYFDAKWPSQQERQTKLRGGERKLSHLFFRGHLWDQRRLVVEILQQRSVLNPDQTSVSYGEYLRELASQRIALSLPGCGDFCHRDVEAFAVGTSVLRPKIRNQFHEVLKADFHYVSVDTDMEKDSPGVVAGRIEERYRQVVNQTDYLASVGCEASAWYDRNVRFPQSMRLTAQLLGLT